MSTTPGERMALTRDRERDTVLYTPLGCYAIRWNWHTYQVADTGWDGGEAFDELFGTKEDAFADALALEHNLRDKNALPRTLYHSSRYDYVVYRNEHNKFCVKPNDALFAEIVSECYDDFASAKQRADDIDQDLHDINLEFHPDGDI